MSSVLLLPSTSFLEWAFLRWVLAPCVHPDFVALVQAQHPVPVGEHVYKLDYAVFGAGRRIAIELDGFAFHSDREAFSYDRLRQNDLQAAGWSVVRFSYDSIRSQTSRCVEQLSTMLRSDSLLAPFVISYPIIETPQMEPDPLWSLAPSPRSLVPTSAHSEQEPLGSYFDSVRLHLRLSTLRDCQQQAFYALANYYSGGGQNAACVMAVGAGKTVLGVVACLGLAKRRALIVTPGNVIRGTFDRALDAHAVSNALYGLPDGPLIPGRAAPRVLTIDRNETPLGELSREKLLEADVIITNFHSMGTGTNPDDLLSKLAPGDVDLVVVDEAHIAAAQSYQRTFAHFSSARTLLMSACFERMDGKPIEADVVYRYRLIDSIADGVAKNLRVHRFAPRSEETTYEMVYADGRREEIIGRVALLEILNDERKLARITARSDASIREVMRATKIALERQGQEIAPVKPRALFAAMGEKHAEQLARVARESGISCASLHYAMGETRIRETIRRFESDAGDLQALVQLKMLGQGYDFPAICVVVPMRPYGSFSEFYQFIGRGIRVLPSNRLNQSDTTQMMDVILHAEMALDGHIETLHRENDLASTTQTLVLPDEASASSDSGVGGVLSASPPLPQAWVLWEQGQVEQRIIHDENSVEQHRQQREREALAQRYAAYAQKTPNPMPFGEFLKVIRQFSQ